MENYKGHYEAIDEFGIDMRKEIVEPLQRGQDKQEVLEAAAEKVWAYYQTRRNCWDGKVELRGKKTKDTYRKGNWNIDGKHLILDIDGDNRDLKEYLPTRLSRFAAMCEEYHLAETLTRLGHTVRMATEQEDCLYKADLFITLAGTNKEYAVSVFKNTTTSWQDARKKLIKSRKATFNRVAFSFDKYMLNTKNIDQVQNWCKGIKKGLYQFN